MNKDNKCCSKCIVYYGNNKGIGCTGENNACKFYKEKNNVKHEQLDTNKIS